MKKKKKKKLLNTMSNSECIILSDLSEIWSILNVWQIQIKLLSEKVKQYQRQKFTLHLSKYKSNLSCMLVFNYWQMF